MAIGMIPRLHKMYRPIFMTHEQNAGCNSYKLIGELEDAGILAAADDRKLNSFSCACCRLIWDDLVPEARLALELAERYVSGTASSEELFAERIRMWKFCDSLPDVRARSPEGHISGMDSQEVSGTRAVICCLGERDPQDPDPNYERDHLEGTMMFCNRVKPNQSQAFYQIMIDIFGSPDK